MTDKHLTITRIRVGPTSAASEYGQRARHWWDAGNEGYQSQCNLSWNQSTETNIFAFAQPSVAGQRWYGCTTKEDLRKEKLCFAFCFFHVSDFASGRNRVHTDSSLSGSSIKLKTHDDLEENPNPNPQFPKKIPKL